MAGRGVRRGGRDFLSVLRAAAPRAGVHQHQAGVEARRPVADGGLYAEAARVQNRRSLRGGESLHARTAGKVIRRFRVGRDRGIRQGYPGRSRPRRHVRADRPGRAQMRIGTAP